VVMNKVDQLGVNDKVGRIYIGLYYGNLWN